MHYSGFNVILLGSRVCNVHYSCYSYCIHVLGSISCFCHVINIIIMSMLSTLVPLSNLIQIYILTRRNSISGTGIRIPTSDILIDKKYLDSLFLNICTVNPPRRACDAIYMGHAYPWF
jgi:hypothetical protein